MPALLSIPRTLPTAHRAYASNEARWRAVRERDAGADGTFVYSVRTTGVYCRPHCAARLALRRNVAFHATCEEAEQAGFRPCKRCRPSGASVAERQAWAVADACRFIEESSVAPNLSALAQEVRLSPHHFHRLFKTHTGLTPRAYAAAQRARRVRCELGSSGTVTSALYEAGFNSSSRFYELASDILGMSPTKFKAGGAGTSIRFAVGQCKLGALLVAATEIGVCAIFLGDNPEELTRDLQNQFSQANLVAGDKRFQRIVALVANGIENPALGLQLPLDIQGTAFQQRVWQALREIPMGSTASYAEIARKIGQPKSVRAVARACGTNSLAVAIPCHRVVRTSGDLAGYRWGIERKEELLRRERGK